jgi:hypothetical protein
VELGTGTTVTDSAAGGEVLEEGLDEVEEEVIIGGIRTMGIGRTITSGLWIVGL